MNLKQTLESLAADPEYASLHTIPGVQISLRYASTQNFMGQNVYGVFTEAFLHRRAAQMLAHAAQELQADRPGLSLLVLDALRPRSIQHLLWNHVVGTSEEPYVANPVRGSMHNYGCAVDLTVIDPHGDELDMGSGFDAFIPLSEPRLEDQHLASGELQPIQLENRLILRNAMTRAGFIQLSHEWWHYDAFSSDVVRSEFRIIE